MSSSSMPLKRKLENASSASRIPSKIPSVSRSVELETALAAKRSLEVLLTEKALVFKQAQDAAHEENANLERKLREMEKENELLAERLSNARDGELKLCDLEGRLNSLQADLDAEKLNSAELEHRLAEKEKALLELNVQVVSTQSELEQARDQCEEKETALAASRAEKQAADSERLTAVQAQLAAEHALQAVQAETAETRAHMGETHELVKLREENERMKQSLAVRQARRQSTAKMQEENTTLSETVHTLRARLDTAHAEIATLKSVCLGDNLSLDSIDRLDALVARIARLESDLSAETERADVAEAAALDLPERLEGETQTDSDPGDVVVKQESAPSSDAQTRLECLDALGYVVDPQETRILHMLDNPAARALQTHYNTQRASSCPPGEQTDAQTDSSSVVKKVDELKKQMKSDKTTYERLIAISKKNAIEYRKVFQCLTGFIVKITEDDPHSSSRVYSVQSVFDRADPTHVLKFRVPSDTVTPELLANEYTDRWSDFVTTYLHSDDSLPAFLAALQLQLHQRVRETSNV